MNPPEITLPATTPPTMPKAPTTKKPSRQPGPVSGISRPNGVVPTLHNSRARALPMERASLGASSAPRTPPMLPAAIRMPAVPALTPTPRTRNTITIAL